MPSTIFWNKFKTISTHQVLIKKLVDGIYINSSLIILIIIDLLLPIKQKIPRSHLHSIFVCHSKFLVCHPFSPFLIWYNSCMPFLYVMLIFFIHFVSFSGRFFLYGKSICWLVSFSPSELNKLSYHCHKFLN